MVMMRGTEDEKKMHQAVTGQVWTRSSQQPPPAPLSLCATGHDSLLPHYPPTYSSLPSAVLEPLSPSPLQNSDIATRALEPRSIRLKPLPLLPPEPSPRLQAQRIYPPGGRDRTTASSAGTPRQLLTPMAPVGLYGSLQRQHHLLPPRRRLFPGHGRTWMRVVRGMHGRFLISSWVHLLL